MPRSCNALQPRESTNQSRCPGKTGQDFWSGPSVTWTQEMYIYRYISDPSDSVPRSKNKGDMPREEKGNLWPKMWGGGK